MISPHVVAERSVTGPQDPGGGEARLTVFRHTVVTWPVFQPTSRSAIGWWSKRPGGGWIVPDLSFLIICLWYLRIGTVWMDV